MVSPASAARLPEFLPKVQPAEIFPGADRIGPPQGDPLVAPVFAGDRLVGHVWLNTDVTDATGYCGKPIAVLVAADVEGVIRGIKLMEHHEPIVLIGIPQHRIVGALNRLVGAAMGPVARGEQRPPQTDIVSGATVTVLVIADSVMRSTVKLLRGRAAGRRARGATPGAALPQAPAAPTLAPGPGEVRDWDSLLGDGSVRRLHLSIGEVNEAFLRSGNQAAADNPEPGDPDDTFIDLYAAPGQRADHRPQPARRRGLRAAGARLRPGQQAILVAGEGVYSFKGSGYVRGGIFDRIELSRMAGRCASATATTRGSATSPPPARRACPRSGCSSSRRISASSRTEPWQLQLLVQRAIGARDKAFLTFELGYRLPEQYLDPLAAARCRADPSRQPRRVLAARRHRACDGYRRGRSTSRSGSAIWRTKILDHRHHCRCAADPDRHLLLPGPAGAAAAAVSLGAARLPALDAGLARLVSPTRSSRSSTS